MNRTENLSKAFNDFWKVIFPGEEDLCSKMSTKDFVNLKKAISNINNIITLDVTKKFVEFLKINEVVSECQSKSMLDEIERVNANANGFDIEFPLKKDTVEVFASNNDYKKIIAEVKCCIPVGEESYGAAQKNSILKDIESLKNGKTKSKLNPEDINEYLKFLVLLGGDKVKDAAQNIIDKASEEYHIDLFVDKNNLSTDEIYVIIIEL